MNKGTQLLNSLLNLDATTMVELVQALETLGPTDLHNVLSKTAIVRALASLALQDKKFPLKK